MKELSKKLQQYNVLDLQVKGADKQLDVKHDHDKHCKSHANDGY